MTQLIYKVFRPAEWQAFEAAGRFDGSEADRGDGFIHFSKADQLAETLQRHYATEPRVAIAAFQADRFGDGLKWETSRGGDRFPHLYAPLHMQGNRIWKLGPKRILKVLPEMGRRRWMSFRAALERCRILGRGIRDTTCSKSSS